MSNVSGVTIHKSGDCFLVQTDVDFAPQHDLGDETVNCEAVMFDVAVTYGGEGDPTEVLFGRFAIDTVAAEPLAETAAPDHDVRS